MNKEEKQNSKWEAVIGLEIHAELKTKRKMFCSCANAQTEPNMDVCPVCLGMPGTLPVLNRQAVEWTILTGLALNCKIGHLLNPRNKSAESVFWSKWDRKNYFYPDLPKGYQISQYDLPIAHNGSLKLKTKNEKLKTIGITRIHLEEDTGTSKHPEGRKDVDYSLLDFNRAGIPLMELVTEPDLRSASEAKLFCQNYQQILRTLKVADADMEKGQLRAEVNISLRPVINQKPKTKNQKLGTKVEIKNLNSFRSVERAIEYEIERQIESLKSGEKVVQETRGWDEKKGATYIMRSKETSADYRYFPEPDLPPVILAERGLKWIKTRIKTDIIDIEKIKKQLTELPQDKAKRYIKDYQLAKSDAQIIANDPEKVQYFELCIKYHVLSIKQCANYLINEVPDLSISPKNLVELINLVEQGKISGKVAKEILPEVKKGKSPEKIIKGKGLEQISDTGAIEKVVEKIIKENPDAIAKIKSGKIGVMGFLVGRVMRETKGQANPKMVNEIIRTKIK